MTITVGTPVRRRQGHKQDIGRMGTVTTILGSISGDTRVVVRDNDGSTWEAYTRQLAVLS